MYEVPATSAFVLLFTEKDIYDGSAAKRFLSSVDLTAGQGLKDHFKDAWDLAYAEIATRKVRVKQLSQEYLHANPGAQVVSLGGGLDPMTLDLAELFPEASVFDVDMDQMDVKAEITAAIDGPRVHFVTAHLGDASALTQSLMAAGWDAGAPTLVVAEGITYYVPAPIFAQALAAVRTDGGALVLEYSLPDDEITDANHKETMVAFYPELTTLLQLPFPMVRYSSSYVQTLAGQLRGKVAKTLYEHEAELLMKGRNEFFGAPDSGVIRVSLIRF